VSSRGSGSRRTGASRRGSGADAGPGLEQKIRLVPVVDAAEEDEGPPGDVQSRRRRPGLRRARRARRRPTARRRRGSGRTENSAGRCGPPRRVPDRRAAAPPTQRKKSARARARSSVARS
jgi:hypothetical protein